VHPPIEPYASGLLEVGDGHRVYWEGVGNPEGYPVVYLHGGPGSGATAGSRRWFDPAVQRAVILDQRGCGRSTPRAEAPDHDLATNTTQHLIADLELLRQHLGIDRWALFGLSWGSTLALAYALAHRDRVTGIVLGAVTTGARDEIDWITEGVGRIFPAEWERFAAHVPAHLSHRRIVEAYAELLADPDPAVHGPAAVAWCAWEDAHVSLAPGATPNEKFQDPAFRVRFARLVTHYWSHDCFLGEDGVRRAAAALDGVPGVMVHGRHDISGPLITPWRLAKCWPTSTLHALDDAGHGTGDSFPRLLIQALAELPQSTDGQAAVTRRAGATPR